MTATAPMATKVTIRGCGPCRCGCGGTDSQHREWVRRVVHDLTAATGTQRLVIDTAPMVVTARGRVKLPYGERIVYRTPGFGWVVAAGQ
jgi:hypothetical protein